MSATLQDSFVVLVVLLVVPVDVGVVVAERIAPVRCPSGGPLCRRCSSTQPAARSLQRTAALYVRYSAGASTHHPAGRPLQQAADPALPPYTRTFRPAHQKNARVACRDRVRVAA